MVLIDEAQGRGNWPGHRMEKAFRFLREMNLASLAPGQVIPIDGDEVFAQVQAYTTSPEEELAFETHDRYFDVQCVVEGREFFGLAPRSQLAEDIPYDAANDITFYKPFPLAGRVLLQQGDWAVVSPATGHKPRCAAGGPAPVKKIVVKVLAE